MSKLLMLVDYDNVATHLSSAGPVNLARVLIGRTPVAVLDRHRSAIVRLYGGWRNRRRLTQKAQQLAPIIHRESPTTVQYASANGNRTLIITVELADAPIGLNAILEETLAYDRSVRKFRSRRPAWAGCATPSSCGFTHLYGLSHASPCNNQGCTVALGDVFVRDEQKMVDTLIVADIAQEVLVNRATDVVVVSSDADMWPGVLLALRAMCEVTHLHAKPQTSTQQHLLNTLTGSMGRKYHQITV